MVMANRICHTDVIDAPNLKLGHLEAQMTMTCGDVREPFANLFEDFPDGYLHSVPWLTADVWRLASELSRDGMSA